MSSPSHARLLLLAAVLHVLAVALTPGFFHPDEHYQTIEWASALIGRTDRAALTWEYGAHVRSWAQPMLYAAIGVLGPRDPFQLAFLFRLVSSLIGLAGIAALAACVPKWFEDPLDRKAALIALTTFYFLPIFHARTSAENLAGSAMMIAVWLLTTSRAFAAGFALGLAFLFRYQMGFMIAGAVAWSPKPRVFAGLGAALALGVLLDRLGYGFFVLAPLDYARVNLIEGRASAFGEAPPWQYAAWLWHDLIKPFGAVVIGAVIGAWIRAPRNLLSMITLPFVVAHVILAHKEPRFLFPLLDFAPLLLVLAMSSVRPRIKKPIFFVLLAINSWALLTGGFHPPLSAGAWMQVADPKISLVQRTGRAPYGEGLHPTFYDVPRVVTETPTTAYQLLRDPAGDAPLGCTTISVEPPIARMVPVGEKWVRQMFGIRDAVELDRCGQ